MENRETIFGLEERQRGILYASLALIAITLVATRRMWDAGGLGAIALAGLHRRRRLGACTASGAPTASTDPRLLALTPYSSGGRCAFRLSRTPTTSTRALRRCASASAVSSTSSPRESM